MLIITGGSIIELNSGETYRDAKDLQELLDLYMGNEKEYFEYIDRIYEVVPTGREFVINSEARLVEKKELVINSKDGSVEKEELVNRVFKKVSDRIRKYKLNLELPFDITEMKRMVQDFWKVFDRKFPE